MSLPSIPTWQIAPWIDMPRLEAVLECSLQELEWAALERLISDKVPEDLSLDYKAVLQPATEDGRFELGKDVAAFANAVGGLIIVGISESNHLPSGFSNQQPNDADRRRVISTLVDRLAPFVSDIEIGLIGAPDGSAGCLLILVPPSSQAPHAVTSTTAGGPKVADGLWWPVREGTQTRWLREAELASRYRDRFSAAVDVTARSLSVMAEGVTGLDRADRVWLALGLAPTRPALNRALSAQVRDQVQQGLMTGAGYPHYQFASRASFGRGRVVLSDRFDHPPLSRDHHVELHMDGSGFAAIVLPGELPSEVRDGRIRMPPGRAQGVLSAQVAMWLISLLDLCARHAVLFGAGSEFEVVAQLLVPLERDEMGLEAPEPPVEERRSEPVVLTELYGYGARRMVHGSDPLTETKPVSITTPASVGLAPRELVAACAQLANEIFAEFGQLPADTLLELSGVVSDKASLPQGLQQLRGWAEASGLLDQP